MKPAISEAIPATATALMRVGATTSRLAASGGGVSDKQPQIIVSRSSENSVTAPTGRPKGSRHANQRGTLSGSDAMNIWCRI